MRNEPQTFPTIRSWQRMSERQQDAMLDRIEARRRRRGLGAKVLMFAVAAAVLVGSGLGIAALIDQIAPFLP